jgi:hypothetical protein
MARDRPLRLRLYLEVDTGSAHKKLSFVYLWALHQRPRRFGRSLARIYEARRRDRRSDESQPHSHVR